MANELIITKASISSLSVGSLNATAVSASSAAINVSAGTTSNNLSQVVFSNANGVSFGLNGSTITASAAAGGGGITYDGYAPHNIGVYIANQIGNAQLHMQPLRLPYIAFDRILLPINYSNATNSSNSFTVSFWVGFYTKNGSTLSSVSTFSTSYNVTNQGTVGSYSLFGGMRQLSIGLGSTGTLPGDEYFVGVLSRTTTGGGAGMTMSNIILSQLNSSFSGIFGSASNNTAQFRLGIGMYSATTSYMPATIGFNQLTGNSSQYQRPPVFIMGNGTA